MPGRHAFDSGFKNNDTLLCLWLLCKQLRILLQNDSILGPKDFPNNVELSQLIYIIKFAIWYLKIQIFCDFVCVELRKNKFSVQKQEKSIS